MNRSDVGDRLLASQGIANNSSYNDCIWANPVSRTEPIVHLGYLNVHCMLTSIHGFLDHVVCCLRW